MQDTQVPSLDWEDPWRKDWLPTLVFLPGESRGQMSLVGYSPRGHRESDTTEPLPLSPHLRRQWHVAIHSYQCTKLRSDPLFLKKRKKLFIYLSLLGLRVTCRTFIEVCGPEHGGSVVEVHGLSCPKGCGIVVSLPRIKCTSPASEGRFFTAGPPGKPPRSEPLGQVCFERQNDIRYSQDWKGKGIPCNI